MGRPSSARTSATSAPGPSEAISGARRPSSFGSRGVAGGDRGPPPSSAAATAGINRGDTVAVIGVGPVGFVAVGAARLLGAGKVLALDREPDRLALAEAAGAETVNVAERNAQAAVHEATEGRGADVVIEAVGQPAAFETAVDIVRRCGT